MVISAFLGSTADIPKRTKLFESAFRCVLFSRFVQEALSSLKGQQHLCRIKKDIVFYFLVSFDSPQFSSNFIFVSGGLMHF